MENTHNNESVRRIVGCADLGNEGYEVVSEVELPTEYVAPRETLLKAKASKLYEAGRAVFALLEHARTASPDQRRLDLQKAERIIRDAHIDGTGSQNEN